MRRFLPQTLAIGVVAAAAPLFAAAAPVFAAEPTRQEVELAMRKAVKFFHQKVASGGGYVWRYSSDLEHRQGEAVATRLMIWVQPPGTPAVGDAYLDAFEATGNRDFLKAAEDAAQALVKGQLVSGGWYYHVELDPDKRGAFCYRVDSGQTEPPEYAVGDDYVGGWADREQYKNDRDRTIVDDDVTPSTVRLLARLDRILGFQNDAVHQAVTYALESLLKAQYPIGAWSHNYDRFPPRSPDAEYYPVVEASYPESWPPAWPNDWTGCYHLNDRITTNMILAMLDACEVYGDRRCLASARRGADFLIRSQMPNPQPAWAQQYDRHMHPVWERPFEPPAITGLESQDVLETLLVVYRKTGDKKYLAPIPRAIAYLRESQLGDGRLARFYELKTNRPLYFERHGKRYDLTHMKGERLPTHYAFVVDSRLDAIQTEYERLVAADPSQLNKEKKPRLTDELAARARAILDCQDDRGAWTEPGWVRNQEGRKVVPPSGIIESATFVENMKTLSRYVRASR
ncbi:MAG: polysaccharide lyase [Planctomycetota bacterium]|jgi:hypothetical protein